MEYPFLFIVLIVLSGCAAYYAQPIALATLMNAFETCTLGNPALRRYVAAHCDNASFCATGVWNLSTLTLAAFYFSPALDIAYVYQSSGEIGAKVLATLVAVTLLIAGSAHVSTQHASDVLRYSPATGSQR